MATELHGKRDVLDMGDAIILLQDVNLSDVKIEKSLYAGMTIDGVKVSDLFETYEAAKAGGK